MENEPLELEYLKELLRILKDAGVAEFRHGELCVAFEGKDTEEDDEEQTSTDVRGFVAPLAEDDDDEDLDSPSSMHRRAFGGKMPTLMSKKLD